MDEKIEAVQNMQDYIEAHLAERITPAQLAKAAAYSPWYASRLFSQLLGLSPAEYIRRLRLAQSALKLRDEQTKIIDVAYENGFTSVDGYQRAFFKEFGCNPKVYAMNPVPICLFKPYGVRYAKAGKENKMKEVQSVFVCPVEKPERKVIIKRGKKAKEYWEYCEEVGCDVWGLLTSIKGISGEPVCLWLPEKLRAAGTSEYVQGVEVESDYQGVIPEGFDVILLPACTYLQFQGEPFAEERFGEAIQDVKSSIDKFDFSAKGYCVDRENPRVQLEPIGTRGYIEMIPVKTER